MNAMTFDFVAECFAWCVVQVTLFAAAALIIYALLRRRNPTSNVLLLAGSLMLVGMLTLTCWSPWPRWEFVDQRPWLAARPADPIAAVGAMTGDRASPSGGTPRAPSDRRREHQLVAPRPSASLRDVPPAEQFVTHAVQSWWRFAAGVTWLLAAVGIARFLFGFAFVHRYRRQGVPIDDSQLLAEFSSLAHELEIAAPVELVEAPSLGVAATLGWRQPIVLLPAAWRDWSDDERRAVLAHELAHVAQRHFPLWLVGQLVVAAHFYHPLVHWLGRRLQLEQEIAADRLAAQVFGNRRHYATVLAGLALSPNRPAGAFAGLGLFMSRPLLMRRIAMLRKSTESTNHRSPFVRSIALASLVIAAGIAFGFRSARGVAAADEPASVVAPSSPPAPAPQADENTSAVTALIQIASDPVSLLNPSASEQSWKVFSRTQAALLSSKVVLQSTLRKPDIAKLPLVAAQQNPLSWLDRHLSVGFIEDSEILRVTMSGDTDELGQLRQIVDAVVQTYMEEIVTADGKRRFVLRDALANSYQKLSEEIRNKLDAQNLLAKEVGFPSSQQRDPETELLMRELAEAAKSRAELERKLADVQMEFLVLEQRLKDPSSIDALVDQQLANDPNMSMMNQELMELQFRLNAQTGEMKRGRSKEAERLQQQINAKQQQIVQYKTQLKLQLQSADKGNLKRDFEKYPIPRPRVPHDDADQWQHLRKEFQIRSGLLQQQIAALNNTIEEKIESLTAKNQISVELEIGAAELKQLQYVARQMSIKLEMMDIDSVAPPRVRVIQWAM